MFSVELETIQANFMQSQFRVHPSVKVTQLTWDIIFL